MIIKFHFIVVHYGEGKNTAYDRKGLSENGFCVLNGKIDKKDISFDKQTRRRHHHHRRPTQDTPHSLLQIYFAKKKYNQLIQTKHSITCLTS